MPENTRKPAIRFAGFMEKWEERRLGDFSEIKTGPFGSTLHADDYVDDGIPIITTEHFKSGQLPTVKDGIPQVSDIDYFRLNSYILKTDDIVFSRVGSVDINALVTSFQDKWLFSGRVLRVRSCAEVDSIFLHTLLETDNARNDIVSRAVGQTMPSINTEILKITSLCLPQDVDEQLEIGKYFHHLDHLITLHQLKYTKLLNMKKAMLEKMFPKNGTSVPEIRFAGFTDTWEQHKWVDTVDISTEMVDPKSGKFDNLPHVAPGNIESFTGRLLDNIKSVGDENLISGKFHFYPGDVVYGKINPQLGKYVYALFEGLTSADAYVLNAKNGLNQKFLFGLLQSEDFFKYSVSVSKRSGMPKINRDELNAFTFSAPSEQEQNKIGTLLLTLDHLITLHQRKLERLQNIKKACLEKMFV